MVPSAITGENKIIMTTLVEFCNNKKHEGLNAFIHIRDTKELSTAKAAVAITYDDGRPEIKVSAFIEICIYIYICITGEAQDDIET